MRLQLTRARVAAVAAVGVAAALGVAAPAARADDRAEVSTSLFAEKRDGNKGGLTVVHPQADFGIDLGRFGDLLLTRIPETPCARSPARSSSRSPSWQRGWGSPPR